jgi:hypothetical protein
MSAAMTTAEPNMPGEGPYLPAGMATTVTPSPGGGHLVRNILMVLAVGAILLVMVVAYMGLSGAATGDRVKASHDALNQVSKDHLVANAKLKTVFDGVGTVKGADFDPEKARSALAQGDGDLDGLKATDRRDLARIEAADRKVQDRSALTLIGGSILDREHRRLQADGRAVRAELTEIETVKSQLAIISGLMTMLVQLKPLNADLNAVNVAAGEKDYAAPSGALDKVIADANAAPVTPSKFKEFLALFRVEMTDIKGILDGAQARNLAQIRKSEAALQGDLDKLKAFDNAAMEQQYTDLGKSLDAKVTAELDTGN